MSLRKIEGLALIELAVPFTLLVDDADTPVDDQEALTEWLHKHRYGDQFEGVEMANANSEIHEVVDFSIDDAWLQEGEK